MACRSCGASLPEDARFCGACGTLVSAAPVREQTSWQAVSGPIGHLTLQLTVACDHCAGRVPIIGPTQTPLCPHCHGTSRLERFCGELLHAARGETVLGSLYTFRTHDQPVPQCVSCGADVPVGAYFGQVGGQATIPCPACGAGLATFPAPDWMRRELPDALQIFGADAEVAREQAQLELAVDRQAAQPIVMACPSCKAALTITPETARATSCAYCQVSIFLPDELWKVLHPVKVQRRWTLTYRGRRLQPPAPPQGSDPQDRWTAFDAALALLEPLDCKTLRTLIDTELASLGHGPTLGRLVVMLTEEFERANKVKVQSDVAVLTRLTRGAEKALVELRSVERTQLNLPFLTAKSSGPIHFLRAIDRKLVQELR